MAVLITYLYLTYGGGSPEFLNFIAERIDAVKAVIVEDERQKAAINILELMQERSKEHNKQVNEIDEEINNLIENRDAELADITAVSDSDFEHIQSYSSDILDLRFQLKELVTREEWADIYQEKALESAN